MTQYRLRYSRRTEERVLATVLVLLALIPVGAASLITGDFSQMVYKPSRRAVHLFLKHRNLVIFDSVAIWILGLAAHLTVAETSRWLLVVTALLLAMFTVLAYGMSPYVVFPSLRRPDWISALEADRALDPDEDVIGVVVNGDSRAYPVGWSFRPHLVQDTVGGEEVVMSYCLLSNLGVTFRADVAGEPMHCIMPIQWENNMVIYDKAGDRLIQQVDGTVLYGRDVGTALTTYPTQIMPWQSWRELHPDTKVLHNPPRGVWDRFVRRFIGTRFLEENRLRQGPMFPTIAEIDDRLPSKEEVVGVEIDGVHRAYPVTLVEELGAINDDVGRVPIVVAAHRGAIAVFDRRVQSEVETFSVSPDGELVGSRGGRWGVDGGSIGGASPDLVPVPNHNRVLWFIWSNFNPTTEVVQLDG